MRIERTAKTVIAGLMSVACLASVAACGPGSSSNKANTETEAVSTDLGDTKYELKLWVCFVKLGSAFCAVFFRSVGSGFSAGCAVSAAACLRCVG
ncbi:hypothetical protein PMR39_05970, partial [Bifidobacterium longum]|nr:hypothetical protein [Bifidobacterium longum]